MKHDGEHEQSLVNGESPGSYSDENDLCRAPRHRSGELAEVEAQRGGCVEIEIGVMDGVIPPERRHFVLEHVPDVESVIEEQNAKGGFKPSRQPHALQQPVPAPLHQSCER